MKTIAIQIGNSDNKLDQFEWHKFCSSVLKNCELLGSVHFAGGSPSNSQYQNYCVVVCCESEKTKRLRELIKKDVKHFKQDSVAWLEGEVEFVLE